MADRPPFEALQVEDLERIDVAGVQWRPLRRRLGISAFGTNAYTADAGEHVVEPHTEGDSGHEELYVVLRGHARFTLAGEEVDGPQGTLVFVRDRDVHRQAVALEDGTTVLAVGGAPGTEPPSAWEARFAAQPLRDAGRHAEAAAMIAEALEHHPDDGAVHFDLACALAAAGDEQRAREHLRRAFAARPEAVGWARDDEDLASLRDELP